MIALLDRWKEIKGYKINQTAVLSIADLAEYAWCDEKSRWMCRVNEGQMFGAVVEDWYRYTIGGAGRGNPLELKDVEKVGVLTSGGWEHYIEQQSFRSAIGGNEGEWQVFLTDGANEVIGNRPLVVKGETEEELFYNKTMCEAQIGCTLLPVSLDTLEPWQRGIADQMILGESYKSIRWNFKYGEFIIVGDPDGIAGKFAYEFKSTASRYLSKYVMPVASLQADLYAYFFRKPEIRVQIYIREEDEIITKQRPVDTRDVEKVLSRFVKFVNLDPNDEPMGTRVEWKHRNCEVRLEGLCTLFD